MTKLDESEIIKIFQTKLGNKKFVSEDVETVNFGETKIIAKTDTLVESTDIPPKMKLKDAARKSVVACVSDFAAKGIKPQYGMISVNLPDNISRSKLKEITKGFKNACQEYDISILGGDTNSGNEIVFNVCIFGKANNNSIVKRKGAKKGDSIFVTGPFGYTPIGLDMVLHRQQGTKEFARKTIKSFARPTPRLDFGLKNQKYFSSSMDSSDGLSTTLNEMSRQSKKKFIINNNPATKDLKSFAESKNLSLEDLVFHGGEEYEFAFTVSPKYRQKILKSAKMLKTPIIEIGHVAAGKGVFLCQNENNICLKDLGWKHFR